MPTDAKTYRAKYAGRCVKCSKSIAVGQQCFYSPSLRKIGCTTCWSATNQKEALQKIKIDQADDPLQDEWQRLCTYLRTCILAEAGESLFNFNDSKFPTISGVEQLFSKGLQSVVVEGPVIDQRLGHLRSSEPREFLYGWPTVVVPDPTGRVKVAPLFVVTCEFTRDSNMNSWKMEPKSDPDLNVALLSGKVFDASIAAEVDAATDGQIAFGSTEKLISQVLLIAETLGLTCKGLFDSSLEIRYGQESGIYNCAMILDANDNGASRDLLHELELLSTRTDWKTTAAGALIDLNLSSEGRQNASPVSPTAGPILLNRTQESAADSTRANRLTVVTGPPGTGKSQLVVGAVANAWLDKETVLVTSTNNAAVDVAVRRAREISTALLMRTGNKAARETLPSLVSDAISHIQSEKDTGTETIARSYLSRSQIERKRLHALVSDVEEMDTSLTDLAQQIEKISQELWPTVKISNDFNREIEISERVCAIQQNLFFRKRRLKKYLADEDRSVPLQMTKTVRSWAGTIHQFRTLRKSQTDSMADLDPSAGELINTADDAWVSSSLDAVAKSVGGYLRSSPAAYAQIGVAGGGGGGKLVTAIELSMRALRGWACTTLSMNRNFPLKPGFFDLSIVDEASQCNIAYILPIAYRSKRILVVGDPNQLPPIVQVGKRTVDSIAEATGFLPNVLCERGLDFVNGSAYRAFENIVGVENVVLLNEHYRCHPKIARWFNQAFYGGALQVVTDVSAMNTHDRGISWIDVQGTSVRPTSGRSWQNQQEVELAAKIVEEVIGQGLSVGVVSPFSAQAAAIQRAVEQKLSRERLGEIQFTSGTAHRLQGDERDVIIFSCCVAPGILKESARWVEKERNLINVAVSRARQKLTIIGHPSIGTLDCPTLSSLRNFAVDVSSDGGRVGHRVDSESELRLLDAMVIAGLSPLAKVEIDGFELDFAIIDKQLKLNIEVDGDQHFDARRQQRRHDIVRDKVLSRSGWSTLRFQAWQCLLQPNEVAKEVVIFLNQTSHHK